VNRRIETSDPTLALANVRDQTTDLKSIRTQGQYRILLVVDSQEFDRSLKIRVACSSTRRCIGGTGAPRYYRAGECDMYDRGGGTALPFPTTLDELVRLVKPTCIIGAKVLVLVSNRTSPRVPTSQYLYCWQLYPFWTNAGQWGFSLGIG
jgi:hypothetical protein